MGIEVTIAELERLLEEARNEAAAERTAGSVLWRWRERLVPKTLAYLYMGASLEDATKSAVAAGEYSASRVYEVSIDGGTTWLPAPPDMPVIDIEGNEMPADRRKSGKPSDAAKAELQRRLENASVKAVSF